MTIQERLAPGKYKLTIEDYERLAEAGAFGDQRTELIDGEVIVMSPQFRPHGMVKLELYDEFFARLREMKSTLRPVIEFSLDLAANAMPDPDIMLTTEPRGKKAVPLKSVALVVEISDSTLANDLGRKLALYAVAAVPEYWVADISSRIVRQMWAPERDCYSQVREIAFGKPITAATVAGLTIDTTNL